MTLGLWKVAGTPIEGAISNNRGYITLKAIYDYKGKEQIDYIKVFDAFGNLSVDKKL